MRPSHVLAVVLAAAGVAAGTARAGFTTNLLVNPGAETGDLTGWTKGGTSNPFVDNGTFDPGINPHSGRFDFAGGTGPSGTLTQRVSLVGNQGITAAMIDSGTLTANIAFYEQGLNQGTPSDDAFVSITFRDASGAVLGTLATPEVDSHDGTWLLYSNSYAILAGTRSIDYTINFMRHAGNDLDAFVDDTSLTVSGPTVGAPAPSNLSLLGFGAVSLFGFAWHRRRGPTNAGIRTASRR